VESELTAQRRERTRAVDSARGINRSRPLAALRPFDIGPIKLWDLKLKSVKCYQR